jgi:hypothetical protein
MFLAIALDDPLFALHSDLGLINAWRQAGRPLEVHLYERGGHGFGMSGKTASSALWIDQFYAWMKDSGFLEHTDTAVKSATGYSVSRTTIGELLDDPAANAILKKHLPMIAGSDQVNPRPVGPQSRPFCGCHSWGRILVSCKRMLPTARSGICRSAPEESYVPDRRT